MRRFGLPLVVLALASTASAEAKTLAYCLEGSPATLSPALAVSNIDNTASADPMFDGLTRIEPSTLQVAPALAEREALRTMVDEYARAITTGEPALTDGRSGLRVLAILQAATRSLARGGTMISIDEGHTA